MTASLTRHLVPLIAVALLALPPSALACGGTAFDTLKRLVGQWDVFRDGERTGELHMRSAAGGCALIEEWETVDGTYATGLHWPEQTVNDEGETVNVLHQVYIDNKGWFLHADGTLTDGALIYEGKTTEDGQELVLRATLEHVNDNEVVHVADMSMDGGETWQRTFTLNYRRIDP